MILRSPTDNEKLDVVMPAWIAGIQARKDASGDIHVKLDSSTPCWNDVIERTCLNRPKLRHLIFEGAHEGPDGVRSQRLHPNDEPAQPIVNAVMIRALLQ